MAYALQAEIRVVWVPDGAGGMTQANAQALAFFPSTSATGIPTTGLSQIVPVPGANAPSAANFTTALATLSADIAAQIAVAATLARIQAFSSGGG